MKELLVVVGVVVVAAIALLVQALCRISRESDDAMDKAMEGRRVKEILLPGASGWIKNPALHRDARRKFEEPEADDE